MKQLSSQLIKIAKNIMGFHIDNQFYKEVLNELENYFEESELFEFTVKSDGDWEISISGGYVPATHWEPEEGLEVDIDEEPTYKVKYTGPKKIDFTKALEQAISKVSRGQTNIGLFLERNSKEHKILNKFLQQKGFLVPMWTITKDFDQEGYNDGDVLDWITDSGFAALVKGRMHGKDFIISSIEIDDKSGLKKQIKDMSEYFSNKLTDEAINEDPDSYR